MQNEKFRRKPNIQHQDVNILKVLRKMQIGVIKHFHARNIEELNWVRNRIAYLNAREGRWSSEYNKDGKFITVTRIV